MHGCFEVGRAPAGVCTPCVLAVALAAHLCLGESGQRRFPKTRGGMCFMHQAMLLLDLHDLHNLPPLLPLPLSLSYPVCPPLPSLSLSLSLFSLFSFSASSPSLPPSPPSLPHSLSLSVSSPSSLFLLPLPPSPPSLTRSLALSLSLSCAPPDASTEERQRAAAEGLHSFRGDHDMPLEPFHHVDMLLQCCQLPCKTAQGNKRRHRMSQKHATQN